MPHVRHEAAGSPFALRGVVEGFYGPPYTFPQRDALIAWMGERGFNLYIYGPKNDRQHRNRWREPYPAPILERFGATVAAAAAVGVTFCYAISPSVSMCYADPEDFALLTAKLARFYERGVRAFALFFDDIDGILLHQADLATYGSAAIAHAAVSNRLLAWLKALDPACTLCMCPTEYYGSAPFSGGLWELGALLEPAIDVFYTGPSTCAAAIGAADARAFGAALRRPPLIWDNYPVNDLAMKGELHLGPIEQRDPALAAATRGIVANPMLQPQASRIALATYADFLADPVGYVPAASWRRALHALAGPESEQALLRFAENALHSVLHPEDAPQLALLVEAALASLGQGEPPAQSAALQALGASLDELDEASYHLKNRMEQLELRAELLPWIELCDLWLDSSRRAVRALYAHERGESLARLLHEIDEYFAAALAHHKRYAGQVLAPFVDFVRQSLRGT